jgi:hypothetical protein
MDLFNQKRYVLLQDIEGREGVIPMGSEVTLFRGFIYLNGGMVMPSYAKMFTDILNDDNKKEQYFMEIPITYNKI